MKATDAAGSPPRTFAVEGQRLTLLAGGTERLAALIDLIDRAEHSLRLLYYIYANDDAGRTVRTALARALGRGVTVALIVDDFGSALPEDFFAGLAEQGADICRFVPRFGRRYLLRNHQKLALADERIAIVGGFNIADDYFDDARGWRDLGLRVDGSVTAHLARYFDALARWTHQPNARLRDLRRTLSRFSQTNGRVRWLLGGPTRRLSPWARALRGEVRVAARLDIIAAYFAPTPRMMRAIESVVRRGGTARVLTAAKSDNDATIAAARHTYHRLLKRGVQLFEYQPTKLHTKLFVADDAVYVGSANFDVRSLFLNLEIMLRVEDGALAAAMRAYFDGELSRSAAIDPARHERASWLTRLRWSAAYWLVSVADGRITRRISFDAE
ncbi:phospholipase D-like domain-containing protein [Sphingomonas nostoxanthinifaciens]|uniref:phospholipase D-like domain-containing protein n=1 Tax=Sphingomonas nostoxanthinifaciens TaxID=2872652 RepID=UPI001CC1D96E|nr:phosphatidylserine/phosphatidylglycerophosphate/cardiolipin synthase family protein [Sphingomonas nostoxanthinifaciens]UAK24113.1 phosphatidylserine/phosphatidylglycerophosphate/cardiolipin synthase family protein [Sphingomonas nostoxanthinifaciens]